MKVIRGMINMYYYSIGYNSYEDSDYIKLCHEKEFSQKEFSDMVLDCVNDVVLKLKEDFKNPKENKKYAWFYDFYRFDHKPVLYFSSLYLIFAEVLCEKYLFEKTSEQTKFTFYGEGNIFDSENNIDKEFKSLSSRLKKQLENAEIHESHKK